MLLLNHVIECMETKKCHICNTPLIPAIEFDEEEWDEHTWKYDCDCMDSGLLVISG